MTEPSVFLCEGSVNVTPYIVGGIEACPYEFLYQVHLQYNGSFSCGGTILNTFLILTAAHCLLDEKRGYLPIPSRLQVVAGDHDLEVEEGTEQYRNVSHILLHEDYNKRTRFANDIAIIVLETPLVFDKHVRNISLAKKGVNMDGVGCSDKEQATDNVVISGWGLTHLRNAEYQGPTSEVLHKLSLSIVPNSKCSEIYRNSKVKITDGMMCAGSYRRGACSGDSGGPVTCRSKVSNETLLCGIVSFGVDCGYRKYPGVNTDVSYYYDWIEWRISEFGNDLAIPGKCRMTEFFCSETESCIDRNLVCDGKEDCVGGRDELFCLETKPSTMNDTFRCNNGRFINPKYLCDKEDDCGDSSDEDKCGRLASIKCKKNEFRCKSDGRCIDKLWECDQLQDCEDNSDETGGLCDYKPKSCVEVQTLMNRTANGVYTIYPIPSEIKGTKVYCDLEMDGGGWTVFQSRLDKGPRVDFYRNWADYQNGFGSPGNEHWIGLQNLAAMTVSGDQELRIVLTDWDNENRVANYLDFKVTDESDKYRLRIGSYTAGDSLAWHNGMGFTTRDQDNDPNGSLNCAKFLRGAWWYNDCAHSNLNGDQNGNGTLQGIHWHSFHNQQYSLKAVEMKIRARNLTN